MPRTIAQCHKIGDKIPRAECYDEATGREAYLQALDDERERAALAAGDSKPIKPAGGILGELWGFDKRPEETKYGIKQYHPNYIIAYGTNPFKSKPMMVMMIAALILLRSCFSWLVLSFIEEIF